jgi:hypothetical protein
MRLDGLRISPAFSFLQMHLTPGPRSNDTSLLELGDTPKRQAQLRSTISLPHHLDWAFGHTMLEP